MNIYYVYAHVRLDTNTIFYIGKGKNNRCRRKERNLHWKNIVNKVGYKIIILEDKLTESKAFKREHYWIKYYKSKNQCEANYSLGGEGNSGYKWTKEQKERHSKLLKQQTKAMIEGHKKRIRQIKGRTKNTHKGIKSISEKNSGINNGRAIWNIKTPDKIFSTIKETAKYYNISTAAVHKRLKSRSKKFKDWKRIDK